MTAPSTEHSRTEVISFRLTPSEVARIEQAAEQLQVPRTRHDWCRAAALHLAKLKVPEPVPPRLTPRRTPPEAVRTLARVLVRLGDAADLARRLPDGHAAPLNDAIKDAAEGVRKALEGGNGD